MNFILKENFASLILEEIFLPTFFFFIEHLDFSTQSWQIIRYPACSRLLFLHLGGNTPVWRPIVWWTSKSFVQTIL